MTKKGKRDKGKGWTGGTDHSTTPYDPFFSSLFALFRSARAILQNFTPPP